MEKNHLPEQIQTERLTLKKHSIAIAQMMFDFIDRDRERLRQFLPWVDLTKTVEDAKSYIEMTQKYWEEFKMFDYGMYRRENGQYMGNVGVHNIAWDHNRCEIGYWILGDYEGNGYVAETVLALEKTCFDLGFNRVEIKCSSRNLRSARVPMRCGYRLEATLSQDSIELGQYRDTFIFGKLKKSQPTVQAPLVALDFVYLFSPDLATSKKWYEEVLGIKPSVELENFVEFRPGGHCGLCLHPANSKSPLSTGGSVGYWRVIDFEGTVSHFQKHGAKIYRGPLDIGNGTTICQMIDPIGNVIGFVS